jgi:hypothetical protein
MTEILGNYRGLLRACGGFLACAFGFTSTATSEWMQVLEHCQSGTLGDYYKIN